MCMLVHGFDEIFTQQDNTVSVYVGGGGEVWMGVILVYTVCDSYIMIDCFDCYV